MKSSQSSSSFFCTKSNHSKVLTSATFNPRIVEAEYAVRGELVLKSLEYQKRLDEGDSSLPFDKIISCNIGNPHSLGQKPITFNRQVLSLVNYPELLNLPETKQIYPSDVIARAKSYIQSIPGGTGAYSHSKGVDYIRNEVANFLLLRDGYPSNPEDIFLTDGASQAVQSIIRALIRHENDGILVPIPQYPLYSATITMCGGQLAGYFLDESNNWGLSVKELKRSLEESKERGIEVRALVVINPGNPTGQCLPEENMKEIIHFCLDEKLILMADEVYQENVYAEGRVFNSFKKVLKDMGSATSNVELVSFHSTSKGFLGECGRRGGLMELVGFHESAKEQLYKSASVNLCANVEGQIMVGLMTNPPKNGDPSYSLYVEERDAILSSLKRRAEKLVDAYNQLEGVRCNPTEGALYTFPSITLSKKAVLAAKNAAKSPDAFYCLEMLKQTGVVVVPGSGFGQVDGTWHFRSTILPSESEIDNVISRTTKFHKEFMKKYQN